MFDLLVRERGQIQSGGRGKNDPKNNQRGVRTVEAHFSIKRKMQSMKADANAEGKTKGLCPDTQVQNEAAASGLPRRGTACPLTPGAVTNPWLFQ